MKRKAPRSSARQAPVPGIIQNQIAFLARLAELDRESVELRREWVRLTRKIEERLDRMEEILIQHTRILEGLPEALRQKIGFRLES